MNVPNRQFTRFASVGLINTAIDVILFVLLSNVLNLHLVVANTLSTSAALMVGYLLHSTYTFQGVGKNKRVFITYIGVTLVGLWILQPLVITVLTPVFMANPFLSVSRDTALFLAKGASIAVSLLWNYIWYSKVIFKSNKSVSGITS